MDYTDEQKAAIIEEYDRRRANNERAKDIEADFKKRGIARTFQNWRTHAKKAQPSQTQEPPMSVDETPVEVLPGQMDLTQEPSPESKPGIRTLPLRAIVLDAGTQMRVELSQVTVTEFAQDMLDGDQFPPIVVFSTDETTYMLADGFHPVQAAKNALKATISAEVHPGGLDEAIDYACQANIKHGLRPTTADKRKAVLIQIERHPERADREIARLCGCDHKTVGKYRADVNTVASGEIPQIVEVPRNDPREDKSVSGEIPQITHDFIEAPIHTGQMNTEVSPQEPTRTVEVHRGESTYNQRVPSQRTAATKTKAPKSFDVQDIESKMKALYMGWLRHCETDDALKTAQFFLNTLSDLAQGREMQLQRQ